MNKICDLIEIPEVETVIQVSAVEEKNEDEIRKEIVESFVITGDIQKALEAILFVVRREEGCGFLIKGNYGSGKSHFLAFLSALFRYPEMIDEIIRTNPELAGYKGVLNNSRIFPVPIILTDYSMTNSLAEIVAEKMSIALQRDGIAESVWDARRVISDFEKLILPNLKDKFASYLKSLNISDTASLTTSNHSNIIISFLKEENTPFRPFYDYQDIFNNIDNLIAEKFPGGIFLLIDELSEFLRSRNRGDLVSEDIRFIQFLGEKARQTNMRVAMSMQEAIEEVAEISTDALSRIKDRYPVRINLTSVHLRELVERRLLIKNSDTIPFIDDIYISLVDSFPEWKISQEDFRAIYPVHPATLKMLEGITGIFSKTRGMVDFIYTEIKGNDARGVKGIMDERADTLLYPDRIFDHFRNNLGESIDYNKLIGNVYSTFEREIPDIFSNENDRVVALRIIKLILLFQILPGVEKPTAMELTHLVVEARFKLDPDYNYIFIREKILKVMEARCRFLGVERGANHLRDRFYLQFEESPVSLFEGRVRQFIAKNVNIEKQALWFFISRLRDRELPLSDFKDDEGMINVLFENTQREGSVILKDLEKISTDEIAGIDRNLNDGECDFFLYLGFPVDREGDEVKLKLLSSKVSSPLKENIIFWKPRIPSEPELEIMRNAYSRVKVFEKDYKEDKEDKDLKGIKVLTEIVEEAEGKAFRIIKKLYSSGALFYTRGGSQIADDVLLTGSFEKTVELMVKDLLKETFPSHSRIMPAFEIATVETYRQIIHLFRESGEVDFNFESSRMMKNAVDAILKNSGLLRVIQNVCRISPEPSKNVFIKDLLYEIEQRNMSFKELYIIFRKGKYGIQRELFSIYLFFLAYSGFITIEKSSKAIKPEKLNLSDIISSDNIKSGEDISSLFIERFFLLEPFTNNLNSKNIHLQTQKKVWEELVEYKRNEEGNIRSMWSNLDGLESHPLFRDNSIKKIRESYERLFVFISNIKVSKQSREGMDILLESMGAQSHLVDDIEIDKRFRNFTANELERLLFIYGYLIDQDLYLGETEGLKNDLLELLDSFNRVEDLIIDNQARIIVDKFNEFKEGYRFNYLKAHDRIHSHEIIDEIDKIKLTPSYRALSNFSRINTISVKDDLIRVDTLMREAAISVCRRPVSKELDVKPYCDCKLMKGETQIDIQGLNNLIRRGIAQYHGALSRESHRTKLVNYMGALLSSSDIEDRNILKRIMELEPEKASDNDLLRVINLEAISLVNKALSGNIRIIKKRISDFYNSIFGRRFRKGELTKIFNEWLETKFNDDREDLIFEIVGLDEEKKTNLPVLLMDEVDRVISIDDEMIRIQAFALAWLLYDIGCGKYFFIIKKVLFIDLLPEQITTALEIGRNTLKDDTNWGEYFQKDLLDEVYELLEVKGMSPVELQALYKAACGFSHIRERIIGLFVKEEIKITKDIRSVMAFDDSPHSKILSSFFLLDESLEKYYRESGKKDTFNQEYFISVFESLFLIEKIRWLSLNNNILIDCVPDKILSSEREIWNDCEEYYKRNIENWGNDVHLAASSMIDLAAQSMPVLIIIDSLRTDLFLLLGDMLYAKSVIKVKKMNLFLSPYPSDTMTFRKNIFPGIELDNGSIFEAGGQKWIFISAAEREYKKDELWKLFRESEGMGIILSFSIFDEKIHSTKQGIISLSEELLLFCEEILIPLIKGIPKERRICITSDHGFIGHKIYGEKNQPRYSHGGNSFYERVIPFAIYNKI